MLEVLTTVTYSKQMEENGSSGVAELFASLYNEKVIDMKGILLASLRKDQTSFKSGSDSLITIDQGLLCEEQLFSASKPTRLLIPSCTRT